MDKKYLIDSLSLAAEDTRGSLKGSAIEALNHIKVQAEQNPDNKRAIAYVHKVEQSLK